MLRGMVSSPNQGVETWKVTLTAWNQDQAAINRVARTAERRKRKQENRNLNTTEINS
jgi:hypothetical protein